MATILIADDAAFMRMKSAQVVQALGHEVIEASDGVEAVNFFKERSIDHQLWVGEQIFDLRERADHAVDMYHSALSIKQNETMRVLSIDQEVCGVRLVRRHRGLPGDCAAGFPAGAVR